MRTKHLFVLIHIRNKGEVCTMKLVSAVQFENLLSVPRRRIFCGSFLLNVHVFMFRVCHAVLSVYCSLVVAYLERAKLSSLFVMFPDVLSLSQVVSCVRCST